MRTTLSLLLMIVGAPLFALDASNVLLIANEDAEGSVEIAEYYAELRGVPDDQILKIKIDDKEEITRELYRERIREPVTKYVNENDNILVIVPTRGVPLKIKETDTSNDATVEERFLPGRDFASVDSELALVRQGDYEIESAIENPLYNGQDELTRDHRIFVVSRLDGPTVEIAKGLVEKAIIAEALGCRGESFLDTRGPSLPAGHQERDDIMAQVGASWKNAKLPFEHDQTPQVLDLSTRSETLHYYGWYSGDQEPKGVVKFRTGGVCVHLHSFSARTIRDDGKNWVGPLLKWNCTATYGTVYEPLTIGFPYENIFWDRLTKGDSFGMAGLRSNRLFSWQSVFVGDPLYTPYREGYADKVSEYRNAVSTTLTPSGDEPADLDTTDLPLFDPCARLLRSRAEVIAGLVKADMDAALLALTDLRFLVAGMGLESWISLLAEPFDRELQERFAAIEDILDNDLTDTEAFEAALKHWKGLPIYEKLLEFKIELIEDQEDEVEDLVRKAKTDVKRKRWLLAYVKAAEGVAHKFAPSAVNAGDVITEIENNATVFHEIVEEANDELQKTVDKVERAVEDERWERAEKYLGREWRFYPDCDNRAKLAKFAKRIADGLATESD